MYEGAINYKIFCELTLRSAKRRIRKV